MRHTRLSSPKNTSSASASTHVPIGYISKAHGIRGEVALVFTAEAPELLQGAVTLQTRDGTPVRTVNIIKTRVHHGARLVVFESITTRTEAELLRGLTVSIPEEQLPPLDENEVFLSELPGLQVIHEQDNGTSVVLGELTSVDIPAGQVLWTITTPDGKEILFPAVEEFVLSIDLEAGETRIAPPPGLLDLYLQD